MKSLSQKAKVKSQKYNSKVKNNTNNRNQNGKLEVGGFIVSPAQMGIDLVMAGYDIWGTMSHVAMLYKQAIIDKNKAKAILGALLKINEELQNGKYVIDPEKGAQLTLEANVLEKTGETGLSMHTGRSRNDQVITTEMLYLREEILTIVNLMVQTCSVMLELAKKYSATVMPGYTHMQAAKPTIVGQWVLAYCNSLVRAIKTLQYYYSSYDMSPLGACEGYGTSWPLDRAYSAKLLGFSGVWEIPQDAISSRGFYQLGYLNGLTEAGITAGKIGQDLLLFNTFEYGFVSLGEAVAQRMHPITGSSVMAQKKNPDALELIRATSGQMIGLTGTVANIINTLPMGYNRDVREVKEYVGIGFDKAKTMLTALIKVIETLQFDEERMWELVIANYSLTTDLADFISQKTELGYRLVYKIVGKVIDRLIEEEKPITEITVKEIIYKAKDFGVGAQYFVPLRDEEIQEILDPKKAIERRKNIGGCSKATMEVALQNTEKQIEILKEWLESKQEIIREAREKTEEIVRNICD